MRTLETDVLIVGSGFGAAAPALRLSRADLQVLMIEKGPDLDPARDLRQTQDPRYLMHYLKGLAGDRLNLTYAEALGGASAFYEMVSLRAPSVAFEQTDSHGRRLWPDSLSREALDPYYDLAERMLHVEQIPIEEIPKTGLVFARMMKNLGLTCDRARYAVRGCVGSGYCVSGCIFGAKQSLHVNYLPQARAAGAVIECNLEARSLRTIAEVEATPREGSLRGIPLRYEVLCRRTDGGAEETRIRARLVILGGGTVGTASLLLRSRRTLRLLSRHVGQNLAFNGSVKAAGMLADHLPDGDLFVGRTHPGMISYDFLESHGVTISGVKALPIQLVAGARLSLPGSDPRLDYWGPSHVDLMKDVRRRVMILYAIGLTPPTASLSMNEGEEKPRVHLDVDGKLSAYYQRTKHLLDSILARNGCRPLRAEFIDREGVPYPGIHFFTAHQMGSCRMADSRHRGVCDASGEVFHYPGLYVSDGAAIPSSLAVNASLTILANAERIAAGIVERHRPRIATETGRRTG
jgi:choline dehydrogenase-like flavoprotein